MAPRSITSTVYTWARMLICESQIRRHTLRFRLESIRITTRSSDMELSTPQVISVGVILQEAERRASQIGRNLVHILGLGLALDLALILAQDQRSRRMPTDSKMPVLLPIVRLIPTVTMMVQARIATRLQH